VTSSGPSGRDLRRFFARHRAAFALFALGVLLVAGVGTWAVSLSNRITAIPRMELDLDSDLGEDSLLGTYVRPERATGPAGDAVNILVGGVDARDSSRLIGDLTSGRWVPGSHRSDTIMVLHVSADRSRAHVISVAPETWVPIDGYGLARIDAALSFGGPTLFVRTLEQFTGLRMDHLVIVDRDGFRSLVDALGGAEVRRRQNLARALSESLVAGDTLLNPLKLTEVLEIVTSSVAVDQGFSEDEMRRLARSLRDLDAGLTHLEVPVEGFDRIDGQRVVQVDAAKAGRLFAAAVADELDEYVAPPGGDTMSAQGAVD
jgi:LCP family protein required for cell wall assembly